MSGAAMKRGRLAVLGVLAAILTACGGEQPTAAPPPPMDTRTAQLLARDVAAVRSAAERRDRARGERALAELTHDVAQAQAQGRLSAHKARTILAAGAKVAEDFDALPTPRPPRPGPVDPDELKQEHGDAEGQGGDDRRGEEGKKGEKGKKGEEG